MDKKGLGIISVSRFNDHDFVDYIECYYPLKLLQSKSRLPTINILNYAALIHDEIELHVTVNAQSTLTLKSLSFTLVQSPSVSILSATVLEGGLLVYIPQPTLAISEYYQKQIINLQGGSCLLVDYISGQCMTETSIYEHGVLLLRESFMTSEPFVSVIIIGSRLESIMNINQNLSVTKLKISNSALRNHPSKLLF